MVINITQCTSNNSVSCFTQKKHGEKSSSNIVNVANKWDKFTLHSCFTFTNEIPG